MSTLVWAVQHAAGWIEAVDADVESDAVEKVRAAGYEPTGVVQFRARIADDLWIQGDGEEFGHVYRPARVNPYGDDGGVGSDRYEAFLDRAAGEC